MYTSVREELISEIGHEIGRIGGRIYEYYEEDEEYIILFYYNEISEYVEIPKDSIKDYRDLDLEFMPVA